MIALGQRADFDWPARKAQWYSFSKVRYSVHALALLLIACGEAPRANSSSGTAGHDSVNPSDGSAGEATAGHSASNSAGSSGGASATVGTGGSGETGRETEDGETDGIRFDVAEGTGGTGGVVDECKVGVDGSGATCSMRAPADSWDLQEEWAWAGDGAVTRVHTIPLVANLTDDNGDGVVDLCDVPDIVLSVTDSTFTGAIYVLSGADGSLHWKDSGVVRLNTTMALGDLDGDGVAEIVATSDNPTSLRALKADGTELWVSDQPWDAITDGNWTEAAFGAIGIADLDADGDPEIYAGSQVWDHTGKRILSLDDRAPGYLNATTAHDLDGDGDLELILGRSAYHHDGTEYYRNDAYTRSLPQVADLDDDGEPEVLIQNRDGMVLLAHDGTLQVDLSSAGGHESAWHRPSAIHDVDGDGSVEILVSVGDRYGVREPATLQLRWDVPVVDASGSSSSTAFDFLGDGTAEAMYADEEEMFVLDAAGATLLQAPRSSRTFMEYPIVVDVDGDKSAEILVPSGEGQGMGNPQTAPPLRVYGDRENRWIQARRIWNQHTYHVTNVNEDGTIPSPERPHWKELNTFRTNAQIEDGGVCRPVPVG